MQPRQWPAIARFAPGPTVFQVRGQHDSDLRLETQETRPRACSGHMTTRSMFPQHLRSPMLTFATRKLSTGAQGQKEDTAPPFVSAVLIELSCFYGRGRRWPRARPICIPPGIRPIGSLDLA